MVAGMIFVALLLACKRQHDSPQDSLKEQAQAMALNIISNSLIAPTSAKFSQTSCSFKTNGLIFVSGQVDSQNSFGAMLRKSWLCILTNEDSKTLLYVGQTIDGNASFSDRFK